MTLDGKLRLHSSSSSCSSVHADMNWAIKIGVDDEVVEGDTYLDEQPEQPEQRQGFGHLLLKLHGPTMAETIKYRYEQETALRAALATVSFTSSVSLYLCVCLCYIWTFIAM